MPALLNEFIRMKQSDPITLPCENGLMLMSVSNNEFSWDAVSKIFQCRKRKKNESKRLMRETFFEIRKKIRKTTKMKNTVHHFDGKNGFSKK